MISVVIPVIREREYQLLMEDILNQTVLPKEVIVIDNRPKNEKTDLLSCVEDPNVFILMTNSFGNNIGVNKSWVEGSKLASENYIAILNDDIRIDPKFFEKAVKVFQQPRSGVITPTLVREIPASVDDSIEIDHMTKREGWCWIIRKIIMEQAPDIPYEELPTFCGDDWYWFWAHKLGYRWVKLKSSYVVHISGANTASGRKDFVADLKNEKRVFQELIRNF